MGKRRKDGVGWLADRLKGEEGRLRCVRDALRIHCGEERDSEEMERVLRGALYTTAQRSRFRREAGQVGVELSLRRMEVRLGLEVCKRRRAWQMAKKAQADRMRQGLTHTCSDDDPDGRYEFVIRMLKGTKGAPLITGFRMGDAAKGEWVQHPPSRVRKVGGRILEQVNKANQQNVDLNAVSAWHNVFVPKWEEIKGPGGEEWKVCERMDERIIRRAVGSVLASHA